MSNLEARIAEVGTIAKYAQDIDTLLVDIGATEAEINGYVNGVLEGVSGQELVEQFNTADKTLEAAIIELADLYKKNWDYMLKAKMVAKMLEVIDLFLLSFLYWQQMMLAVEFKR